MIAIEVEPRIAKADSNLDDLRLWLRHQKEGYQFKRKHISGQRAGTRAHNRDKALTKRKLALASSYRITREALVCLGQLVDDKNSKLSRFQPLHDKDLRGPLAEKEAFMTASGTRARSGEGFVQHSWLWNLRLGISEGATQKEDEAIGAGEWVSYLEH
jgi:hypothetical protein